MSFQVGPACYASAIEAGGAACSQFQPVTSIDYSGVVRTVACTSADASTGALNLDVVTTSGVSTTHSLIQQQIAFPPCSLLDYVQAGEQIFGALLATVAISWGAWQVVKMLNWSRGSDNA